MRHKLLLISSIAILAVGCNKMEFASTDLPERTLSVNQSGVVINSDAPFTNSSAVSLTLQSAGAKEMYITNDASCESGGNWVEFNGQAGWTLEQTNSQARVYAKFRDGAVVSECFSDSILHDDIAPLVQTQIPSTKFITGSPEHLGYVIIETGSGLQNTTCTQNSTAFACGEQLDMDLSAIAAKTNYLENIYTVTITARDLAGNVSAPVSISYKVLPKTLNMNQSQSVLADSNSPDVLFVVDSSKGTMNYQWNADFQRGFGSLSDALDGLNWQASLITADPTPVNQPDQMSDGQLVLIPNLSPSGYILTSSISSASALFAGTMDFIFNNRFSYRAKGIESSIRAMERSATNPAKNFFRKDSHLAVVIYSDQDEALDAGETSDTKVTEFKDAVKNIFGPAKKASVYSIIRPAGDTDCRKDGNKQGLTYDLLAKQTDGLVNTICAPDFSQVMSQIGHHITTRILQIPLSCVPYNDPQEVANVVVITKNGVPQSIPFTLSGNLLKLANPLPAGDYEFQYSCVQP